MSTQCGSWLPPEKTTQKAEVMLQLLTRPSLTSPPSSPPQNLVGSHGVALTQGARTTEGHAPLAGESWAVWEAADHGSCWLCSWEGWPGAGHPRRVSWRGRRVPAWSSLPYHGPKRGEGPWSPAGSSPMAHTQRRPRTAVEAPRAQRAPTTWRICSKDALPLRCSAVTFARSQMTVDLWVSF